MTFPLEPDDETLSGWIAACGELVRRHTSTLSEQPASDVNGALQVARSFREGIPERGQEFSELLDKLLPAFAKSFNTAGPGYLAFIPGGGLPSAALAGYLALALNRYTGVGQAAPALAELEAQSVRWLAEVCGYPASARGVLTSGGSISNLCALVTAREARIPDVAHRGVIYASSQTHACVAKSARIAGFSSRQVRLLEVDVEYRLRPETLRQAVAQDRAQGLVPLLVVANIGTTNTGAVDPLDSIIEIARAEQLWVHGDAAYGGFFRMVDKALTAGMERCDSLTLDPPQGIVSSLRRGLPVGSGRAALNPGVSLERRLHARRPAHGGAGELHGSLAGAVPALPWFAAVAAAEAARAGSVP